MKTNLEQRSTRLSRCCFPAVVWACLSVTALAWAKPGYLPAVGPAALRFRASVEPSTNGAPAVWAPVIKPMESVTNDLVSVPSLGPDPGNESYDPTNETPMVVQSPRPDEVISPQMLIRYFDKSTNGATTTAVAPIDFTLPPATAPPSSKATYSTTP